MFDQNERYPLSISPLEMFQGICSIEGLKSGLWSPALLERPEMKGEGRLISMYIYIYIYIYIDIYIYMACNGVLTPATKTKTNRLRLKPSSPKNFLTALQRFLRELI